MGWTEWSDRVAASKTYDLVMRLPGSLYFLAVAGREALAIRDAVAAQMNLADPTFLLAMASRLALVLFFATQIALFLIRRRPTLRASGMWPRVSAVIGATLSMAMVLLPRAPLATVWNLASILLILVGNYLSLIVVAKLGRSLSILPEARRLVTDGPYRWARHPLYLTEEIAIIGVFIQFRSLPAAAIVLVHFGFQLARMHNEEAVLRRAFPEYEEYRRRTAMLIPGVI